MERISKMLKHKNTVIINGIKQNQGKTLSVETWLLKKSCLSKGLSRLPQISILPQWADHLGTHSCNLSWDYKKEETMRNVMHSFSGQMLQLHGLTSRIVLKQHLNILPIFFTSYWEQCSLMIGSFHFSLTYTFIRGECILYLSPRNRSSLEESTAHILHHFWACKDDLRG